MNVWSPLQQFGTVVEGPDGPLRKLVGWVLGTAFTIACALGTRFSLVYDTFGYLAGQLATVLAVQAYVVAQANWDHVTLFTIMLSTSEKRLYRAHPLFILCPIAATSLAHFLQFTRIFGFAWLRIGHGKATTSGTAITRSPD
jgi:hypothetical protein